MGLKVAVIGGGIGGMAAAAAMGRAGASVTVFEQAAALGDVGAGLQVSANGQRVLTALDAVSAQLDEVSVSDGTRMLDGPTGRVLAFVPKPRAGATWYMHRADLLGGLTRAAQAAGVQIELGHARGPDDVDADVVIAADGGQSAARAVVDGPVDSSFSGQVAWRALVPWTGPALPSEAQLFMGSGAHMVIYPLRQARLVNVVAVEERQNWEEEGWSLPGDPAAFRTRFGGFRGLAGDVVAEVSQAYQWALHLRPVATRWQDGRTVLLGDAAHPTLPFFAQGACLALEDAWVLAACLAGPHIKGRDVPTGLARYQALRQQRAAQIVAIARANAWRFHLPRPWAWGAHLALGVGARRLAQKLEWVYDYDATGVDPLGLDG